MATFPAPGPKSLCLDAGSFPTCNHKGPRAIGLAWGYIHDHGGLFVSASLSLFEKYWIQTSISTNWMSKESRDVILPKKNMRALSTSSHRACNVVVLVGNYLALTGDCLETIRNYLVQFVSILSNIFIVKNNAYFCLQRSCSAHFFYYYFWSASFTKIVPNFWVQFWPHPFLIEVLGLPSLNSNNLLKF